MKHNQKVIDIESADLNELFFKLQNTKEKSAEHPYNSLEFKDRTRSRIAQTFVVSYFGLIAGVFIITLIFNVFVLLRGFSDQVIDVKDILLAVTSIVGTPLGFVVGYYFKGQEEK